VSNSSSLCESQNQNWKKKMIAPSGMKSGSIALYTYYNYAIQCVFGIVVAFTV
jgi:hypothetical protein